MDFEEAGRNYYLLKDRFVQRKISQAEFEQSVNKLVATAPDGKIWRIDPLTASWIELGADTDRVLNIESRGQEKEPQSLLELIPFLGKNLIKTLPKLIMIGLLFSVFTWIAHTYLIAKVNDGLMYDASRRALNSVVHLQTTHFPGVNAFWGLLSYFLTGFFTRAVTMGPRKWLANIISLPETLRSAFHRNGGLNSSAMQGVLLGGIFAFLIILLFRNFMLSWILAIGILLLMTAHFASLESLVLKLTLNDLQRLFRRRFFSGANENDIVQLIMLGMCGGFFLAGIWQARVPFTVIAALLVIAVFVMQKSKTAKTAALFMFITGSALLLGESFVLAYCEGGSLSQAGGNWAEWWGSNNADLVRRLGLAPAGFAFLGGVAGSAAASLGQAVPAMPTDLATTTSGQSQITTEDESSTTVAPDQGIAVDASSLGGPSNNSNTHYTGGDGPGFCSPFGLPNYWINTASLNLVIQDTLFASNGLGPPLKLTVTYNSLSKKKGMFGPGWSFAYDWLLEQGENKITLYQGSGQVITFTGFGEGSPDNPVELFPAAGTQQRLFSYGDYWLCKIKGEKMYYRLDRVPGTNQARLTLIFDNYGNTINIAFEPRGNIATISDASGRSIQLSYNDNGQCTAFTLPDGRHCSFAYDTGGYLIQVKDLLGVVTDYEYDLQGCLVRAVVGREKQTTWFSYRNFGRNFLIETLTDPEGYTSSYELITNEPRRVRVTDAEGRSTIYQSTNAGHTEKVIDHLGHTTSYKFQKDLLTEVEDQNGHKTIRYYDQFDNCSQKIDPLGSVYSYEYDSNDNLLCKTNPLGESWRYTYNQHGSLTKATSPMGHTAAQEYDERGRIVAFIDPSGNRLQYSYDRFGNLDTLKADQMDLARFVFDAYGYYVVSQTDARGNETRFEYDANQRLVKETYADGSYRSFGYNCCSKILATDEEGHSTAWERNGLGNVISEVNPLAQETFYQYDCSSRLTRSINALAQSTLINYNDAGRISSIADSAGGSIIFSFDPAGSLIALKDQLGRKTQFSLDKNNRLLTSTNPLGQAVNLSRDALGRLTELTNARGGRISFHYNADGLLKRKLSDNEERAEYEYDTAGNLSIMRDKGGETKFSYNQQGLVTEILYPSGLVFSFDYDATGRFKTIIYPDGFQLNHTYDSRLRLQSLGWEGASHFLLYDKVGRVTGEKRSNNTSSKYAYDIASRLSEISHLHGDENFARLNYTRDAAGSILSVTGFQPQQNFLEPGGMEASFNHGNQIHEANGEIYTYDADGNLTARTNGWQAVYDNENRLVELEREGIKSSFTYNGLGLRVKKKAGEELTYYYYDYQGRLLLETDASQSLLRRYIYAEGRLVAVCMPDGTSRFYHYDHLGSTIAITDSNGKIIASYGYDSYGLVSASEHSPHNPFTYVGAYGLYDEGQGLYFARNRYYDAYTGRFQQLDPAGFAGGINLYTYADNNPVNYIDPHGLWFFTPLTLLAMGLSFVGGYILVKTSIVKGLAVIGIGAVIQVYETKTAVPDPNERKDIRETKEIIAINRGYIAKQPDGSLRVDENHIRDMSINIMGLTEAEANEKIEYYQRFVEEQNERRVKCDEP